MRFGVIGSSIWQQNLPLIERLTLDRDGKDEELLRLKNFLQVEELVYLSTCNRVEFYYAAPEITSESQILHRLIDFFFALGKNINFFPNDFYHYTGKEGITHLFRTASSLESLVMGENQIAGQLKSAFQEAAETGLAGPILDELMKEALLVARKVKSQTTIGVGALSMASLAFNELIKQVSEIKNPTVAIVGTGKMQYKLARMISEQFENKMVFVNRTVEKAATMANEFGGTALGLGEFIDNPGDVDIIVSATAAVEHVFDGCFLDKLLSGHKQVVCLDLAMPRDFSEHFDNHPDISLIDIARLRARSQCNLRQKFIEAGKAHDIVRESVNNYLSGRIEVSLKPIFRKSYNESLQMAKETLDELFSTRLKNLGEDERAAIQRAVDRIIGHSSFLPVKQLSSQIADKRSEAVFNDFESGFKQAI